ASNESLAGCERTHSSTSLTSGRSIQGSICTPKTRRLELPCVRTSTRRSTPLSVQAEGRTSCFSVRTSLANATALSSKNHGSCFGMLTPRSHEMGSDQHHVPASPEVADLLPEPLEAVAVQPVPGRKPTEARPPGLVHREEVAHLLRLVDTHQVGRDGG